MPDVDFINYDGKLYYYDDVENKVVCYEKKTMSLHDCPECVLEMLIKDKSKKAVGSDKR